ncbi:hypothetical protein KY345_05010 [Candidatus Woesearchaeota archaeon]|nr:hypothetical protein [Candidatus Woesearchaeota archaeon]
MVKILKLILFLILLIIIGVIWYFNFYKKRRRPGSSGYVWVGEGPDPFAKKEEEKKE